MSQRHAREAVIRAGGSLMDAVMTVVTPSVAPSPHEPVEGRETFEHCSVETRHALFRELSSIYRSDLTLCVSSFEIDLLRRCYEVPVSKLLLSPLFYDTPRDVERTWTPFDKRQHFCMIGMTST